MRDHIITEKELKVLYLDKLQEQKLLNSLIKLNRVGSTITINQLKDILYSKIDILDFVDNVLRAKKNAIEISFKELKELYIQRIDVDRLFDEVLRSKKSGLNLKIQDLKNLFFSYGDIGHLIDIKKRLDEAGFYLSFNELAELPINDKNSSKFAESIIAIRQASITDLQTKFDDNKIPYKPDHIGSLSNTYIVSGLVAFERALKDFGIQIKDVERISLELQKSKSTGFKLTLDDLKEIFASADLSPKIIDNYITAKNFLVKISYQELETLTKKGIDIAKYINTFVIEENTQYFLSADKILNLSVAKKDIQKLLDTYLVFKKNKFEIQLEDLDAFFLLGYNILDVANKLIQCQTEEISITIKDVLELPLKKIDLATVLDAMIACHKLDSSLTFFDFKKLLLPHINKQLPKLVTAFTTLKQNEINFTLTDLERIILKKADIEKYVNSLVELKKNNGQVVFNELEKLVNGKFDIEKLVKTYYRLKNEGIVSLKELQQLQTEKLDIEQFANAYLAMSDDEKAYLAQLPLRDKVAITQVFYKLSGHNIFKDELVTDDSATENDGTSVGIDKLSALQQFIEHKQSGRNLEKLMQIILALHGNKFDVDLEKAAIVDILELDLGDLVQMTQKPTTVTVPLIKDVLTNDNARFVFKVSADIKFNIDKLDVHTAKDGYQHFIDDYFRHIVGGLVRNDLLKNFVATTDAVLAEILKDNWYQQSPYEIVKLRIMDYDELNKTKE